MRARGICYMCMCWQRIVDEGGLNKSRKKSELSVIGKSSLVKWGEKFPFFYFIVEMSKG